MVLTAEMQHVGKVQLRSAEEADEKKKVSAIEGKMF